MCDTCKSEKFPACPTQREQSQIDRLFVCGKGTDGQVTVVPALNTACWAGIHPKDKKGKCDCDRAVEKFLKCKKQAKA